MSPQLSEKATLPTAAAPSPASAPAKRSFNQRYGLFFIAFGLYVLFRQAVPSVGDVLDFASHHHSKHDVKSEVCRQAEPVLPKSFEVASIIPGNEAKIREWLGGAVRVPTEIFDVMGPIGEDERWDVFYKFSEYLEQAFPLVHKHLTRTRVMTHALVFEWQGSDPSLKPLLLTGHQDVVPVLPATRSQWTHDPFGGEYEESTDRIWGRGAGDDKSGTIGILSAVELLLESGKFNPARTVILAFGMDEETGGKVGALNLGIWLEEKYGKDSMAILVDEGSGMGEVWGQFYATPAVGEKGYLDVEIRVETPGGHSSVPPMHTGIGIISQLIATLEAHPHEPLLLADSPLVAMISCAADFAPGIPKDLKKSIRKVEASMDKKNGKAGKVDHKALREVQDWWVYDSDSITGYPQAGRSMVSTTQAVDIINGGVKVNALPEVVTAVVNHRINLASSVKELQDRITHVLKPIALKNNVAFEAFGKDVGAVEESSKHPSWPKLGKVIVSEAWNSSLDVAPVSPHTIDDPAWRVFAGTIKGVYATRPGVENASDKDSVIHLAPTISTGNTDTKRYWNLTRSIYRFAYLAQNGLNGAHTVDEWITASNFIEQVRWFATFIVNVDESREI